MRRGLHPLVGSFFLLLLVFSVVLVELHFTGLLPDFFHFLDGLDAKVNMNDGKLTLTRWNSTFLEVGGRQDVPRSTFTIPDGVELSYPDSNIRVYSLDIDDGGIEYSVVLKSKPEKASVDLPLHSANLDFYYQPPLDEELNVSEYDFVNSTHAIKNGEVVESRPENVVGSYAVYHSSKTGNEYGTGKAFHIYRPQLIDADGDKCWAPLTITDSMMKIGLNQTWLISAAYPVVVDPAFGKAAKGGSEVNGATGRIYGSYFIGEYGSIDSVSVYCGTIRDSNPRECALYNVTGSATRILVANTSTINPVNASDWNTATFNTTTLIPIRSQCYYLTVWGTDYDYFYDAILPAGNYRSAYNLTAYSTSAWPSRLTWSVNETRLYSIFANYTTPLIYSSSWGLVMNATANSTYLRHSNAAYGTCWNNASANTGGGLATSLIYAGRRRVASTFYVYRGFLFFDVTQNLSSYSTIVAAKLRVSIQTLTSTWANETAALGVYSQETGSNRPTLNLYRTSAYYGDYNYSNYDTGTLLGTNYTAMTVGAFSDIILDVSAVNRTGITRLIVRTVAEFNNYTDSLVTDGFPSATSATDNNEYMTFATANCTLQLNYTIPTVPTVETPYTTSPYISTSGNLSATCYADGNLSMIVLEDNYTSGTIRQTNVSVAASTTTVLINFTKAWNSSIYTVKWRVWCNDTWGFIGSTEWLYTKIGPQYPAATVHLPMNGLNLVNGTDYTQVGTNENFYNASENIHVFNLTSAVTGSQLEFLNITSASGTALQIYEVYAYFANGTHFHPVRASFVSYIGSVNLPEESFDVNNATLWQVVGASFQPARIRWDFNASKTFSAIGVYTTDSLDASITVAYINVGNWTGNMTEVGQSPVLGSTDYNTAYPGYLNSSGVNRRSDNFTFAPFTISSENVWYIDFVMNWTTTNATWLRVSMYSPKGNFSVDVSPIANATWALQSITLSFQSEPCVDVNSTVISFYSYNSTIILIDNCSLVVTYNSLDSIQTELGINTVITDWDVPLDVLSPVLHALVFPYLNLADDYYWATAYDETSLEWINPVNTTVRVPAGGEGDAGHFSPSIGLLPNGSLVIFVCHDSHLQYYITVNSTTTESNLTMILSNWGSVQSVSTQYFSYPYTVSFSDRLLVFAQQGDVKTGNMTMFTFNSSGVYEQANMIYSKIGSTFYGFVGAPNKLANDKMYFSWVRYNATDMDALSTDNVYCITSADRGSSWTYMNGTACTFPIETEQALIVSENNTRQPIVLDEGNFTTVYYNRFNVTWWNTPASATTFVRYVNGSTLAPNSTITWNNPAYCVDEFGVNITGWGTAFYDSTSAKTFLWVQRSRFDALTYPYVSKYQKTTHNTFFMHLQNSSILNFIGGGYLISEPSVPYERIGTLGQRGICGYEATGATQFNVTQETMYLYPYTATLTENITHVAIRVNMTVDVIRHYFLYDNNLQMMSWGNYSSISSYGFAPLNTWEYVPLDAGHTVNTGIVAGQTYWLGVMCPAIPFYPEWTATYYEDASATTGRKYTGITEDTVPNSLAGLEYTSAGSYTLSVFLISNQIVLYGVWDTLTCQVFSMNATTIAYNTPLAVQFASQWLDYRGLDQVWFTENSTGTYSTAEYNDTEGASTFWCNRTYTLTITSGLLIDCVMSASNSLGDQSSVHLYIYTFAVNLVVGWNMLATVTPDVDRTLGMVCATIQYEGIDAVISILNNGTEYTYTYGSETYSAVLIVATSQNLTVYCNTAGTWYRNYAGYKWLHQMGVAVTANLDDSKAAAMPETKSVAVTANVDSSKAAAKTETHFVYPSFTLAGLNVWGMSRSSLVSVAFQGLGQYVGRAFKNFAGIIMSVFGLADGNSWTFGRSGLSASTFTLASGGTWAFTRFNTVASAFTAAAGRLFTASRVGTVAETFSLTNVFTKGIGIFNYGAVSPLFTSSSTRTWNLLKMSSVTFTAAINGVAGGIGRFLSLFGSTNPTMQLLYTNTVTFQWKPTIQSAFTVFGSRRLTVAWLGSINVAQTITDLRTWSFARSLTVPFTIDVSGFVPFTQVNLDFYGFNTFTFGLGHVNAWTFLQQHSITSLFSLDRVGAWSLQRFGLTTELFNISGLNSFGKTASGLVTTAFTSAATRTSGILQHPQVTGNFAVDISTLKSFSPQGTVTFNMVIKSVREGFQSFLSFYGVIQLNVDMVLGTSVPGTTTVTPTPGTQNPYFVLFYVTSMKDVPLENASITLYMKADQELVSRTVTNRTGYVEMSLAPGEYVFTVTWRQFNYTSAFLHVEEETVKVQLNTEVAAPFWMRILFFGIVGAVLIGGSSLVIRTRRQRQKRRSRTRSPTKPDKHKIKYPEGKPKEAPKHKINYPDYIGYG